MCVSNILKHGRTVTITKSIAITYTRMHNCTFLSLCLRSLIMLILSFKNDCSLAISKSFLATSALNAPFSNSNIVLVSLTWITDCCTDPYCICDNQTTQEATGNPAITFFPSFCNLFCSFCMAQI